MSDAPGDAHKQRGNQLLSAGKIEEAAEAYSEAIEVDPTVAAYWSNRSMALFRTGDAEGALRDATEASKLEPDWAKCHYRRAQALKELGRPREAALACSDGLKVVKNDAEAAELKSFRKVMSLAASAVAMSGWWHGTVSPEVGGFEQEFCFLPEGELRCVVYGEEIRGTYDLQDVEVLPDGLRGGIDVGLSSESVPYLFRIQKDNLLELCCPMTAPPQRPRTFDGPGYVSMCSGRSESGSGLEGLPEGQRVLRYLEELSKVVEDRIVEDKGSGDRVAEKLLDESCDGEPVDSRHLVGAETLEDKAKKMAQETRVQALRVKFTDAVDEIAQRLLKGEIDPQVSYPNESKDLEKLLRRLRRESATNGGNRGEGPADSTTAAQVEAAEIVQVADAKEASQADSPPIVDPPSTPPTTDEPLAAATTNATTASTAVPKDVIAADLKVAAGCWACCFAGLLRP